MPNQYTHPHYDWLVTAVANHKTDECLIWPFPVTAAGYGRLRINGRKFLAHRVAYFLRHGEYPMPHGLHTCDNPPCINPDHIYPGTPKENNRDMMARKRNRQPRGERQACAKLTDDAVRQIRNLYASGEFSQTSLATMFGVHQTRISSITSGKRWTHVK